ncbi:hypothetical protein H0A36_14215 [Endozoicomonas sp. SM1973]|uniref:Uncharacterized protein n=1 Tax=Spartinivicinus marinus TaxID=2994442 RepID=A0A853IBE4_9GAMM|nr:hypothetical protein [Spartinivicinus marinus]MCX4028504.1 hypothetical protein [Spartinivicinus marinus]NYZ67171.1 hypothetical protein [Spartinivicinus marinus]
MSFLKPLQVKSGIVIMSTITALPLYANPQTNNSFAVPNEAYRQNLSEDADPYLVTDEYLVTDGYLVADGSGILNIEHTAFAVIRLKKPLPKNVQFSLNGEAVVFQKVNTAGTVLKCEVDNVRDKWLEITGPQIDIRQLLTFKDL